MSEDLRAALKALEETDAKDTDDRRHDLTIALDRAVNQSARRHTITLLRRALATPEPSEDYAALYLDGGGEPSFAQIDAFLRVHFNARAVYLTEEE